MTVVSKSQQRLMGILDAYKKGELELSSLPQSLADKVKEVASGKTLAKLEVGQGAKINLKKLGLTEGIKVKNVGEAKSLLRKNNIKVTSSKYTTGEQ